MHFALAVAKLLDKLKFEEKIVHKKEDCNAVLFCYRGDCLILANFLGSDPSAAGGRYSEGAECAVVGR